MVRFRRESVSMEAGAGGWSGSSGPEWDNGSLRRRLDISGEGEAGREWGRSEAGEDMGKEKKDLGDGGKVMWQKVLRQLPGYAR